MANIKDIADCAEVGINSVSRYLNQPEALKKSTALKIKSAMDKLGYIPSPRRPGRKTSERVGLKHYKVILLTLGDIAPASLFSMPAYSLYLDSMVSEFNKWDISLEFCRLTPDQRVPDRISPKYCDGVILFQELRDRKFMKYLYERLEDLPVVWSFSNSYDPDAKFDKIIYDNNTVGKIAVDYFFERGHKKVLALTNTCEHLAYAARVRDFIKYAGQLGLEADTIQSLPEKEYPNPVRARHVAKELLENPKYRDVTGLFFASDSVMTGVMIEYRAMGGDFSKYLLLGCNANLQMLDFFENIPASIDIKLAGVGRHTADRLLKKINSNNTLPRANLILTPDIVNLTHEY